MIVGNNGAPTLPSVPDRRPLRLPERDTQQLLEARPEQPTIACVYDYLLGGNLNTTADRDFAEALNRHFPAAELAAANRGFVQRAVHYMARNGIGQFLDLGCGLPNVGSVYRVAEVARRGARVICVDNDPLVCHVMDRATLHTDRVETIHADITTPEKILRDLRLRTMLDATKPVGVIMAAVLHYLDDDTTLTGVSDLVARYLRGTSAGSYLAISHASLDADAVGHQGALVERAKRLTPLTPVYPRTPRRIRELFGDMTLIAAGVSERVALVPAHRWQSDTFTTDSSAVGRYMLCGLARKADAAVAGPSPIRTRDR